MKEIKYHRFFAPIHSQSDLLNSIPLRVCRNIRENIHPADKQAPKERGRKALSRVIRYAASVYQEGKWAERG